jgi:hypothetical protein
MIVIGSQAMMYWDIRAGRGIARQPKDLDLIGPLIEIHQWATANSEHIDFMIPTSPWKFKCKLKSGFQIEFEVSDVNASSKMLCANEKSFDVMMTKVPIKGGSLRIAAHVPSIEYLYLIKRSHIYWPVHWLKTMTDMSRMKKYVRTITDDHKRFYEARLTENEAKFGKRFQANLNQENEKFFAKSERSLNRIYEHDDLHELVKYYERPIYAMLKEDQSKALMSKKLFDAATLEMKLNAIREEAMVIALERLIIPGKETDGVKAYQYGLQRICTNLTSGWFREFAIDNWDRVATPDVDYVKKFNDGIN